ncbi:MAG: MOSC N-terminal beta barrel domain-containing protein [Hyphomicrobium sp.]|uniref:MOSC domain-containing protein n=1 Tax=Hyphomicrobium sp. TaxID=82 RepID=UPI0039E289C9
MHDPTAREAPTRSTIDPRPVLARIEIFPFKSLDPLEVRSARLLPSGAIENDRTWALFDGEGRFVNGKRFATIHRLRSEFKPASRQLTIRNGGETGSERATFHIEDQRASLESWLSRYFGFSVSVRDNIEVGFPDDLNSPGPTLISSATLAEIGRWFQLPIESVRRRFRTNLEIDGVPPFWEDKLFGPAGTTVRFRIGGVQFDGINPCQRCSVPPRDALTGTNDPLFARRFAEMRERTLPPWSARDRFNHFYRVALNTRLAGDPNDRVLNVGDEIEIVERAAAG